MNKAKRTKFILISSLACFGLIGILMAAKAYSVKPSPKTLPSLVIIQEPETGKEIKLPLADDQIDFNPSVTHAISQPQNNTKDANTANQGSRDCIPLDDMQPFMVIKNDVLLCNDSGSDEYFLPNPPAGMWQTIFYVYPPAHNITIDCNGTRLYSGYDFPPDEDPERDGFSYGIYMDVNSVNTNVTVTNCILDSFYRGIFVVKGDDLTIENNTFNVGSQFYISLFDVDNSEIRYNTKSPTSNEGGYATVHLSQAYGGYSENNKIHHNDLYGHSGIRLSKYSNNNEVYNNNLGQIPQDDDYLGLSIDRGAADNIVHDNQFTDIAHGSGIALFGEENGESYFGGAYNNDIYLNTFDNVYIGVYGIHDTVGNLIHDNTFTNITWNGILMNASQANSTWYYPHLNTFEDNTIENVNRAVVLTNGVYDNNFIGNTITNNTDAAILFWRYAEGAAPKATNNTFANNAVNGTGAQGVEFKDNAADDNTFTLNQIENRTGYAVNIASGNNGNMFTYNSFISNNAPHNQAWDNGSDNSFDQGKIGNFWDDFDSPPEGCEDTDTNGICDAPYTYISGAAGSQDNFPIVSDGNYPPIIAPIEPVEVDETGTAIITINAYDPLGEPLTYSVDDPRFQSMTGCWPDRDNSFGWSTDEYSSGQYTVTATANDGVYEDTQQVQVTVNNTCRINKQGRMICYSRPPDIKCY